MTAPALSISTPNGRFYVHPSTQSQVPSITNIIGMKDKPALKYWAARQCAEFAADNVTAISSLKRAEAVDLIRGAPFRKTGDSSEVGNIVHQWIDGFARRDERIVYTPDDFDTAPRTAQRMWKQFEGACRKYHPHWFHSETTVWSDEYEYAGTLDWIASIGGKTVLGDTKTGNGVYPEVGMQLAAIANADYAIGPDGEQFDLPAIDAYAVLHIRPTFARLIPISVTDSTFQAFLGLREVHKWVCDESENVIKYAPKIESAA